MKTKDFTEKLYSIETTQKFGKPNGLGYMTLGVTMLADENDHAGIYQKRIVSGYVYDHFNAHLGLMELAQNKLGSPNFKKKDNPYKEKQVIRMVHYVPTNPQTELQQAWRDYFKTVLLAWQNLTPQEKLLWRQKKYPPHMTGWNRFASYHLKARDL